jgi:hypothetical protein
MSSTCSARFARLARRDVTAVVGLLVPGEDATVVTSEEAVLHDRAQFEAFLELYANGATAYSWKWERSTVAVSGRWPGCSPRVSRQPPDPPTRREQLTA